jgi:hypothetical protein
MESNWGGSCPSRIVGRRRKDDEKEEEEEVISIPQHNTQFYLAITAGILKCTVQCEDLFLFII